MKLGTKRILAVLLSLAMILPALIVTVPDKVLAADAVTITKSGGWLESAYAEWTPVPGATGYKAFVKKTAEADAAYVQLDNELIREYKDGHWRVDAVGLAAGSYTIKIEAVLSGSSVTAQTPALSVLSHDRTGFAWKNGTSSGAYREDGTLKGGAKVIYVTEANKDTVTAAIVIDSKGNTLECKGILAILTALKKGYETSPVAIRFIGNVTDPAGIDSDSLYKGDLCIDRGSKGGMTLEGIGEDATANGWGIRLKNASNVEIRNLGFMNCNSAETDDIGLQQGNNHIWVHNCDFFYGHAGSDKDQAKGDGALDTKTSTYVTHSYNHFWDTGKSNLQGMKSESTENYITYHHNWYDHSDSRHPRIRTCTVHIYNNYYDGNAKYGVGVTMGASVFVENNYFRNCKYPMLISMQGSETGSGDGGSGTLSGENGGIIKAYNNHIEGAKAYVTYQNNTVEFDAYEVNSASETVPADVKAKQGGTSYNNFDTNAGLMYAYTPDTPEAAKQNVMQYAGRMNGGDFKWTFDNSVDDESYAVNQPLKNALTSYTTQLKAVGGIAGVTTPTTPTTPVDPEQPTTPNPPVEPNPPGGGTVTTGDMAHNFTENGKTSNFYQFAGDDLTIKSGDVVYGGTTFKKALKMDSKGKVTFTAPSKGTLTLVFSPKNAGNTVNVNGTVLTLDASGVITTQLPAGAATIVRQSKESHLYYISFVPENTGGNQGGDSGEEPTQPPTEKPSTGGEPGSVEQVNSFVDRLYNLALGRQPDEGGKDSWSSALMENRSSGVNIGYGFVFSDECKNNNLSNTEFVEMLYNVFMDRPSDEGGRTAWVSQLDAGVEREKVLEGFLFSQEFSVICNNYGIIMGTLDDEPRLKEAVAHNRNQNANLTKFVSRCYTQTLGREYEDGGLEAWCGVILAGSNSPKQVAKNFIFSDEFTQKNLGNREYVEVLYRTFFGREADEGGLAAWTEVLDSGREDRDKVLSGFADSVEFDGILKSFNLN